MRRAESIIFLDETHPIDALEMLANSEEWEFSRDLDNEISLIIEGSWREYSLTLTWNPRFEKLRLVCSFEMTPPKNKLTKLFETLNLVNTENYYGTFIYSPAENLMLFRDHFSISDEHFVTYDNLKTEINAAITIAEKFYPTFQIACWGDALPKDAISVAFGKTAGYA